jgi:hypothetical protein
MRAFARCVRLVDIHHYSPLEVRQAVGYCVQAAIVSERSAEPRFVTQKEERKGSWSPDKRWSGMLECRGVARLARAEYVSLSNRQGIFKQPPRNL